jgi:hypothetical protein
MNKQKKGKATYGKRWIMDILAPQCRFQVARFGPYTLARAIWTLNGMCGYGVAKCSPSDMDQPEIGKRIAKIRAVVGLAHRICEVPAHQGFVAWEWKRMRENVKADKTVKADETVELAKTA